MLTKVLEDNQSVNDENHDAVLSSGALPPPVFDGCPRPVQRLPAVALVGALHSGTGYMLSVILLSFQVPLGQYSDY